MDVYKSLVVVVCFYYCLLQVSVNGDDVGDVWSPLDMVIKDGILDGAFPGSVALVANKTGIIYLRAFGNYTYGTPPPYNNGTNPPMALDTMFDMASCTKVLATTTALAQFYQRGELNLDSTIAEILGPKFNVSGKGEMKVRNCLLHNSGFPADPEPSYYSPKFGCPNTKDFKPALDFSCQTQIYNSQMTQSLQHQIGSTYLYSDLNFMTLMRVVGALAQKYKYVSQTDLVKGCGGDGQCYFEAYVRLHVFKALKLNSTMYLPDPKLRGRCAPCANDTAYRHGVSQGVVDDGNAYAAGGISGHAGLFATAEDIYQIMKKWMFSNQNDSFINSTTSALWTKEYNQSQSSRALGWNTNDPKAYDYGWGQSCGSLSPRTFMHIGFTGTMVCADPERQIIAVMLANRVYPTYNNGKISHVRQLFGDAVQKIIDAKFNNTRLV